MNSESKQRINMAHGFMKSVIKNQIDRDNYDKEVKAKQHVSGSGRPRSSRGSSTKPKKPEMQTYTPPQRSKKGPQETLFTLEYEHKDGEIHKVNILKGDSPKETAKRIGAKFDLSKGFVEALAQRLHIEIEKRIAI